MSRLISIMCCACLFFVCFSFTAVEKFNVANNLVFIESQAQLEAFGAKKISVFEGSLIIKNASDLSPLQNLTEIKGMLLIGADSPDGTIQNPELTSLKGLENLAKVGRHLMFNSNPKLENLDALSNLTYVGESIDIINHKAMKSIKGLNNIKHAENITIWSNGELKKIDAFEKITSISGRISLYYNTKLESMDGFSNIKNIGENLVIRQLEKISNLQGFDSLETIGNRLEIEDNFSMLRLDAFANLKSVGFLQITFNTQLQKICGLQQLKISSENTNIKGNAGKFPIVDEQFKLNDCH